MEDGKAADGSGSIGRGLQMGHGMPRESINLQFSVCFVTSLSSSYWRSVSVH